MFLGNEKISRYLASRIEFCGTLEQSYLKPMESRLSWQSRDEFISNGMYFVYDVAVISYIIYFRRSVQD